MTERPSSPSGSNEAGGRCGEDPGGPIDAMERELSRLRRELAQMANLYVSSYRLHGACVRDEVLCVMQEIVVSIVGSEEFGIFERSETSAPLVPVTTFGLERDAVAWVSSAEGVVGACMADGEMRIRRDDRPVAEGEYGSRLSALVPLKRSERTVGLVAIFSMLPHKPELTHSDVALLELLRAHASTSLHYADLSAREAAMDELSKGRITRGDL